MFRIDGHLTQAFLKISLTLEPRLDSPCQAKWLGPVPRWVVAAAGVGRVQLSPPLPLHLTLWASQDGHMSPNMSLSICVASCHWMVSLRLWRRRRLACLSLTRSRLRSASGSNSIVLDIFTLLLYRSQIWEADCAAMKRSADLRCSARHLHIAV